MRHAADELCELLAVDPLSVTSYRKTYLKRVPLQNLLSLPPSDEPCERFSPLGT